MTQQRRDDNSTEFGLWTRQQDELDSDHGFVATNIDYVWRNYKTGEWMYLEEKRHGWMPKFYQVQTFMAVDKFAVFDPDYRGFHILVFTNTSPDDGSIWLDGDFVNRSDLVDFLRFEKEEDWYLSWWPDPRVVRISEPITTE